MSTLVFNAATDMRTGEPTGSLCNNCRGTAGTCNCHPIPTTTNTEQTMPEVTNAQRQAYQSYESRWSETRRQQHFQTNPEDFAGPDMTWPIVNRQDFDEAILLVNHAPEPAAIFSNILKIAERRKLLVPSAPTTNANSGGQPIPTDEESQSAAQDAVNFIDHRASRHAAQLTRDALDKQGGFTSHRDAAQAMLAAAKALHGTNKGKLKSAINAHLAAAVAHDSIAADATVADNNQVAEKNGAAANAHRRAAPRSTMRNNRAACRSPALNHSSSMRSACG